MRNFIASHDEIDSFSINSINPTTIGYYYPGENPSSWTPEEYQEKYTTLLEKLRRDKAYRMKAQFFADQVQELIGQDFSNENITLSSIFRARPSNSEEWSNIGVSITKTHRNGEKEHTNILLSENIGDIRAHILTQISELFAQEKSSNVIVLEPTKDAA